MSYVDNKHEKVYVITYKELIFLFVSFTLILIILYPKDRIKEQILAENSNYDLSMLYLENILEHEQDNEELLLTLAQKSLKLGKKDLSLRLLELVLKSENDDYRNRATMLSYDLKKDDYFYYKSKRRQLVQKKKLKKLFVNIYNHKMYTDKDIEKWYQESQFLGEDEIGYALLKEKLENDPMNLKMLENSYYLAAKLDKKDEAVEFIRLLAQRDVERKEKWLIDEYYFFVNAKEYKKAQNILEERSKNSKEWKARYAEYYLLRKSYKKSFDVYINLFNQEKEYSSKRDYFIKAVNSLQAGKYYKKSVYLGRKYEKRYIKDEKVRKFLLKLYMATGNLNYATSLANKILRKERK